MTDLFAGRSAGGGKGTTAAVDSKYTLLNEKGARWMVYAARAGIH